MPSNFRRTQNSSFYRFVLFISITFVVLQASAQSMLMQHNDLKRTGWDQNETVLTQANVSGGTFGRIFDRVLDDQTYCQPLVINAVPIGGGTHNVLLACTVNNTVYAYDADDSSKTAPYWQVNLTYNPGTYRPLVYTDMAGACGGIYQDFRSNMGIVGTPAVDP